MAILPLDEAIPRFKANEERVDIFTNGDETTDFQTADGTPVPSIRKFYAGITEEVARSIPHYDLISEAEAVTFASTISEVRVAGRSYYRVSANPYTKSAFQDASGDWFSAVKVRSKGPIEVWVWWGQSNARNVTNSPAAIGGDRQARDNVLVYNRGPIESGAPNGWYAVGPEDPGWTFWTTNEPINSAIYLDAAARAEEIGGVVCIVMYALGGQPSGNFIQGEQMWIGLQASWNRAMAAPLPGRGGRTLNDINGFVEVDGIVKSKTRADVLSIYQGEADADYRVGLPGVAANGDAFVVNWRTIFNSLKNPSGTSSPIISERTKILMFELLHGGYSGGGPGLGDPTDDRNKDFHKLLKANSRFRNNIRIIPMKGVNQPANITDPESIGSPDSLHLNGASCNEASRRHGIVRQSFTAYGFDYPQPGAPLTFTNAYGTTTLFSDGRFECVSEQLSASVTNVANGTGGFRSSYVNFNLPMPPGFEVEMAVVMGGQTSIVGTDVGVNPSSGGDLSLWKTYTLSGISIGSAVTYYVHAIGRWRKTP